MDQTSMRIFQLTAKGYCCTQIMLKMALEDEEHDNPDLIRAASGFCRGIAGTQQSCGVLTGVVSIFGLYAGKGEDREYPKEGYASLLKNFIEWFEEEFDSLNCSEIIGITSFDNGDDSYQIKCGDTMVKSYHKMIELLQEHGFSYGEREVE